VLENITQIVGLLACVYYKIESSELPCFNRKQILSAGTTLLQDCTDSSSQLVWGCATTRVR